MFWSALMLQELRVEEEKTQQKTLALEAEVRRLKAELWTGSFGSRGLSPSRSEAPMVQESSVKPRSRLAPEFFKPKTGLAV